MKAPASAENRNRPVHRWVPWIAGFSGQFVADLISRLVDYSDSQRPLVLDPYCGVGTTLVEAISHGVDSVGFEINPYAVLATEVKICALLSGYTTPTSMISHYGQWMRDFEAGLAKPGSSESAKTNSKPPAGFRSRIPFFSESVLPQVLATLEFISTLDDTAARRMFLLALGSVMVGFSNYSYEPSLSTRPGAGRALVANAPVVDIMLEKLDQMLKDAAEMQREVRWPRGTPQAKVHLDSFVNVRNYISPETVDLVVTSPPYLNNYHYIRNTRPQLWWLGLIQEAAQLRAMEKQNLGTFWQTVRDNVPLALNVPICSLNEIVNDIRQRNVVRGPYGGPGWSNYVVSYFNDLHTHIQLLAQVLRPGARAVIVIGNSIIQGVEIKVDQFLSEIAALNGLTTESIDVIRAKRVGSSIVDSSVRTPGDRRKTVLYDAAVCLYKGTPTLVADYHRGVKPQGRLLDHTHSSGYSTVRR